jgi:hypothetical protein
VFNDQRQNRVGATNHSNAEVFHENLNHKTFVINYENDMILFLRKWYRPGINFEYIDKIFDRYFRIPGSKKEAERPSVCLLAKNL